MMNLTTNAYHAMIDTRGQLNVGLREVTLGKLNTMLPDMAQGKYVCLSVSDTGMGMKKSLTEKIFDPFFTTKEKGKGTGMELSVVYGLVRDMKGTITVYSDPGKGTVFHVYLPVEEKTAEDLRSDREKTAPGGDEHILIVDDEEGIIRMESQILERLGYRVTSRSDSSLALECFKDDPEAFDLIITDMAMPKLPGDQLAEKLHQVRPDIPILICTGFSDILTEEKAFDLGIQGLMLKPIITKDLAVKIRELLDES